MLEEGEREGGRDRRRQASGVPVGCRLVFEWQTREKLYNREGVQPSGYRVAALREEDDGSNHICRFISSKN